MHLVMIKLCWKNMTLYNYFQAVYSQYLNFEMLISTHKQVCGGGAMLQVTLYCLKAKLNLAAVTLRVKIWKIFFVNHSLLFQGFLNFFSLFIFTIRRLQLITSDLAAVILKALSQGYTVKSVAYRSMLSCNKENLPSLILGNTRKLS